MDLSLVNYILSFWPIMILELLSYQKIILYSKYHETFFHDLCYKMEENHKAIQIPIYQKPTSPLENFDLCSILLMDLMII